MNMCYSNSMRCECENCGKDATWLTSENCRHCQILLCISCSHDHQERDCPRLPKSDHELLIKGEKLLKSKAESWKARCYEIADAFVQKGVIQGTPRYGHWLGPVKPGTMFYGKNPIQHGWIECPDGQICDPTRWVFEGADPYVFRGLDEDGYYDIGGNKFRGEKYKPTKKSIRRTISMAKTSSSASKAIRPPKDKKLSEWVLKTMKTRKLTTAHVFHLANLPPDQIAPFTKEVYKWIRSINMGGFIPVDNRILILGEK